MPIYNTNFVHVGVDATVWRNQRGYGRHARALLSALVAADPHFRYTFFSDTPLNGTDLPETVTFRQVRTKLPTIQAAAADHNRSPRDLWRMSHALSDPGLDLVLFPTVYSFVPLRSRAKKIVIIHDVIPEMFPALTLPSPRARLLWKTKLALARWQADALVTVSDYSCELIHRRFNLRDQALFVVPEASDPVFRKLPNPQVPPRLRSTGIEPQHRLVVYVGGFGPHKNLDTLINVFRQLLNQPGHDDVHLLLVGDYEKDSFHSAYHTLQSQIAASDLQARVHFTGYLPDSKLAALLNVSTVLVLPSLMEGFGLPAVEAAACGCPVIATNQSPLPALLGQGGIFIDPRRPDEWLAALMRVLESPALRARMRTAGLRAASRLSWDHAAQAMLKVMREVLEH